MYKKDNIHESWFLEDTIDCWRHLRMYKTISPLAKYYQDANWLSIGDGRYGLDSVNLNKIFKVQVFPTDISENMLREGQKMGLFQEYGVENAESLTFENDAFDIIFCKESFHHFPRPIIALYEMIRVAKQAVVLIEPNDTQKVSFDINKRRYLMSALKILFNKIINRKYIPYLPDIYDNINHSYEGSGNYVYSVSNREINKIIHAMDLGGMAYYTFNDCYIKGVEFEKADENNLLFQKIKSNIEKQDNRGEESLTTTIIFKIKISSELKEMMIKYGYKIPSKKDNPIMMAC